MLIMKALGTLSFIAFTADLLLAMPLCGIDFIDIDRFSSYAVSLYGRIRYFFDL